MSGYMVAWLAWGAAFGVIETLALINRRDDDTLSELTRSLFRVRRSRAGRIAFAAAWLGFAGWFLVHIL